MENLVQNSDIIRSEKVETIESQVPIQKPELTIELKPTCKEDNMTRYEDVKNQTTEDYFRGNQFSIDAFNKKYTAVDGETYVQALKRVCDYISLAEETEKDQQYWSARWFDEIYNDYWQPAGSIMQGAASGKKISLANCTTCTLGVRSESEEWDSLESIIKNLAYTVAKSAAYRQGLGVDFSRLRPKGLTVLNSSNESSGAIHWMKLIDSLGYYVGQKGRIPAMLFSISCSHPDVIDFIKVKSDYTQIQNANISVQCTNAFYKAVEKDEDWELFFEIPEVKKGSKVYVDEHSANKDCLIEEGTGRYYYISRHGRKEERISSKVNARSILELIAKMMYKNAEPGIQNIDVARKYSNSDYVYDEKDEYDSRILSTNACSEQYLSRESLCVLSSANVGRFSTDTETMKTELKKVGHSINRFLDNVNEMELRNHTYATPHQRLAIQKLRRTGAGYTNLGAWLFKQNLEYGSEEANKAVEEFTKWYNFYLYESSIELGREKGSFGLFNREKLEKSPFIQRMVGMGLTFDALRNCTCSSIAPTGTLTLQFRDMAMSYGIEPSFGIYYWKRTRISGKYEYYFCVPYVVREMFRAAGMPIPMDSDTIRDTWDGKHGRPLAEFIDKNKDKLGIKFKGSTDVSPMDKLDLMAKAMKWIDSSISVTYTLPTNTNWKDVYNFIIEANKREVKSIAAFPDKKMYGIISFTPFKDLAVGLRSEGIEIHSQNFTTDELKELRMNESDLKLPKTVAPKRPKDLPCDVYHFRIKNKDFFVMVGLLHEQPYEVFAGVNKKLDKSVKEGTITKVKRGHYKVTTSNGEDFIGDTNDLLSDDEEAITRLLSASLRHGADVSFIVDQLEKVNGHFQSFSKSLARALKKYIKNGTKVTGQNCPNCGGKSLQRTEGCQTCSDCSWSKCG